MLGQIYGMKMVQSANAVEIKTKLVLVKRTWKQRLFSRPWKPSLSYHFVPRVFYEPCILRAGDTIYYHPSLERALIERINESEIAARHGRPPQI